MNTQHIFACALCHKPSPQAGCRIRRVKGLRTRICAKCAAAPAKGEERGRGPLAKRIGGRVACAPGPA